MAATGVYLVIAVIFAAIYHNSLSIPDFIYAAGLGISPVILSILPYIVRGIIFGAVFAVLYDFLPGTASIVKGVVLSLFLWIVAVIEIIYTMPEWSGFRGTYYGGTVVLSSVGMLFVGIMSALVFGTLTGFLWDRFRGKELTEERKGRPILLVSFILGGVTWVVLAQAFLPGMIILGWPPIQPEFWWTDLLFTLIIFLGPAGWVLALVAWRKTRRGESGLKLGVAGGIIMALTGVMLLPGSLAIIGGVLSGRKPIGEPSAAEMGQ